MSDADVPVGEDDEHPSDAAEQAVADALDAEELPAEDASESSTPAADAPDPTPSAAADEGSTPSPSASTDAPKASADPRANTVGSRTARYQLTDRIVVLVRNPKCPGTAGHQRFDRYKDGQTVSSYLEDEQIGKFGRADISWDLARGFVAIVPEADVPDVIKSRDVYWAKEDAKKAADAAAAATKAAAKAKAAPVAEASK